MNPEIEQLREQQASALAAAEAIRAEARTNETDNRGMALSPEQEERFDRCMADFDRLTATIATRERDSILEAANARIQHERENRLVLPWATPGGERTGSEADLQMRAWNEALVRGSANIDPELRSHLQGDLSAGGSLVAPMQMVNEVLMAANNLVAIREISRQIGLTGADSLGVPEVTSKLANFSWGGEISAANERTLNTGLRELKPNTGRVLVKVSKKLLRNAANASSLVAEDIARSFSEGHESAFCIGTGVGQPLGVFIASNSGIDTSRDEETAATGVIAYDDLVDMVYTTHKPQYLQNSTWVISQSFLAAIRKMKGTNNEYVWQPSEGPGRFATGDNPATIMGRPYRVSHYAPAVANGAYPAILGDFSYYWIVDELALTVQLLDQLYATTGQNGYVAEISTDAAPVMAEAFTRLKVKA